MSTVFLIYKSNHPEWCAAERMKYDTLEAIVSAPEELVERYCCQKTAQNTGTYPQYHYKKYNVVPGLGLEEDDSGVVHLTL